MLLTLLYSANIDAFLWSVTFKMILNHLDKSSPPKAGIQIASKRSMCHYLACLLMLEDESLMTFGPQMFLHPLAVEEYRAMINKGVEVVKSSVMLHLRG